jgi:hypothetical protein
MSLEDVPPNFARNGLSEKQVHLASYNLSTCLYPSILIAPLNSAYLDAWIEAARCLHRGSIFKEPLCKHLNSAYVLIDIGAIKMLA